MRNLATAMGDAITGGMSRHDDEKREKDEARKRAEQASREREDLAGLVALIAQSGRESRAKAVCRTVEEERDRAYREVLGELGKDPEMVRPINYVERYDALRSVGDSRVVVQKLELTLDQADALLGRLPTCDPSGALERAAVRYAEGAMRFAGIAVGEPDPDSSAEIVDLNRSLEDGLVKSSRELGDGILRLVRDVFDESASPASVAGREVASRERSNRLEDADHYRGLADALRAAIAAAGKAAIGDADLVAGKKLEFELPEAYSVDCKFDAAAPTGSLTELAREVRKSFGTFEKVVADNGVFAAFAGTGSFGSCEGDARYWDDECDPADSHPRGNTVEGIESGIEEDDGGDSLDRCVERMRQFNKVEYWGMLDDDYAQHVDAFWYGFERYMRELGDRCRIDMRPFKRYCMDVDGRLLDACWRLALRMDSVQAKEFAKHFERASASQ